MSICVKRYPHGKAFVYIEGPVDEYEEPVRKALETEGVCTVNCTVYKKRFEEELLNNGVPKEKTKDFIERIKIEDDTYMTDSYID